MSRDGLVLGAARAPLLIQGLAAPAERVIAALLLVILSTVPATVFFHALGEAAAGPPSRALQFGGFVLALVGLWMRRRFLRAGAWPALFAWAFLALACGSLVWSIDPAMTARRLVVFAGAVASALYLATFPIAALARMTARTILVLTLIGLVAAIVAPSIGRMVESHFGAYRGLWPHKNTAGLTMALGLAAALACVTQGRRLWLLAIPVYLSLAVWTDSSTTVLCMALSFAAVGGVWAVRRGPAAAAAAGTALIAGGAIAVTLGPALVGFVTAALDRDLTFTGRTEVWAAVLRQLEGRPLGFGFGTFWESPRGPIAMVNAEVGYVAGSAHNGWIDAWVHFGLPGLALLAAFVLAIAAAAAVGAARTRAAYWLAPTLVVLLASSTSESLLLRPDALHWPLLLACAIAFTRRGEEASWSAR